MPMAISPPDRLDADTWSDASDVELVEYLDKRYGAVPQTIRHDREALSRYLPVVRHDLRLLESYQYEPSEPLATNLVACGGKQDGALDKKTIDGWRRFTQTQYRLKMFAGDHFFPYPNFEAITKLAATLTKTGG
jgi:surfactin synthase thioesterase subunit